MSRKLSLTLFLIAFISMGLVILTGINNAKWDKSASYGQYYFDSLKNDLNEISLIRLSQSGEAFEIKKDNETWMLVNKDSYPADTNKVNTNLKIKFSFCSLIRKNRKGKIKTRKIPA